MPKITIVLMAFIAALLWVFVFVDHADKEQQHVEIIQESSK